MKKILLVVVGLASALPAFAGPSWLGGTITNITSAPNGLYIMLDTGVPDNCVGTPYGWMVIPESARTMVAVTLITRLQNVPVTVYTSGRDASGYCIINQVDPAL